MTKKDVLSATDDIVVSKREKFFRSRLTYNAVQIGGGVILVVLGLIAERLDSMVFAVLLVVYLIVFIILHHFMYETTEQIQARADVKAQAQWRQRGVDDDIHYRATEFLIRCVRAIMHLRGGEPETPVADGAAPNAQTLERVNETLAALCGDLSAVAAKTLDIPMSEAWFRATFMEVQNVSGIERLVYVGWCTQDGNMPRSMAKGITMLKREGVAGLAWERNRPVIESEFQEGREWRNNYTNQDKSYKSMVSVPVQKGYGNDMNTVIGVVTVDTGIETYFGTKDDRVDEDRAGAMVRPYATYIAALYALG